MSTTIRPELTIRRKHYIDRHRYYELKHFCLQYHAWKRAYHAISAMGLPSASISATLTRNGKTYDPTAEKAEKLVYLANRIDLVENVAKEAGGDLSDYLLSAVTLGLGYPALKTKYNIPCGKDEYYKCYRKFFWILDKNRE